MKKEYGDHHGAAGRHDSTWSKNMGANPSGQVLQAGFKKQLDIHLILSQAFVRLIIVHVTSKENGTFMCQVKANAEKTFFPFQFKSNIQVDNVGKLKVKSRNIYIYVGYSRYPMTSNVLRQNAQLLDIHGRICIYVQHHCPSWATTPLS